MPSYEYIHPETGEVKELVQKMTEDHVYIDEHGIEWKRLFNLPNAAIDTDINPFSEKDFIKYTAKKGMSQDLSKELSRKREQKSKAGIDPVKQKAVVKYEKKTGKPHPNKNK